MHNQTRKSANRTFSLSLVPVLLLAALVSSCGGSSGGGGEPSPKLPDSPSVPVDLTADFNGNNVDLRWTESDNANYYEVYRHTSNNSQNAIMLETQNAITSGYHRDSLPNLAFGAAYYYWVTACNNTGCSEFSDSASVTQPSFLSFSNPDNTADSIIGMREFLLTVTARDLSRDTSISFIVSESDIAPDWSEVANHPAKLTRSFSSENYSREIYFSLTNRFVQHISALIDLSSDNSVAAEKTKVDSTVPGIMSPSSNYYVHAYSEQSYISSSEPITTQAYPSNITTRFWAMQGWWQGGNNSDFHRLELNVEENWYLPARMMPAPADQEATCILNPATDVNVRYEESTGQSRFALKTNYPTVTSIVQGGGIIFTGKGVMTGDYYDLMVPVSSQISTQSVTFDVRSNCVPSTTFNDYFLMLWSISVIDK